MALMMHVLAVHGVSLQLLDMVFAHLRHATMLLKSLTDQWSDGPRSTIAQDLERVVACRRSWRSRFKNSCAVADEYQTCVRHGLSTTSLTLSLGLKSSRNMFKMSFFKTFLLCGMPDDTSIGWNSTLYKHWMSLMLIVSKFFLHGPEGQNKLARHLQY